MDGQWASDIYQRGIFVPYLYCQEAYTWVVSPLGSGVCCSCACDCLKRHRNAPIAVKLDHSCESIGDTLVVLVTAAIFLALIGTLYHVLMAEDVEWFKKTKME